MSPELGGLAEIETHEDRGLVHCWNALKLPPCLRAAGNEPKPAVQRLRFKHEATGVEVDSSVPQRVCIVDQAAKNRGSRSQPAGRRPHIHPLDLSIIGAEWLQTADPYRLTRNLGEVEPGPRHSQALKITQEPLFILKFKVDPILREDPPASPLCKLAGKRRGGTHFVLGLNQAENNLGTSHNTFLTR
jgi:hypothetical protein